jgi:hypothetical protein
MRTTSKIETSLRSVPVKAVFFVLLFPLAIGAQQTQSNPRLTDAGLFFSEDASLAPDSAPDHVTETHALPSVPAPGTEGATAAAYYEPQGPKWPLPSLERGNVVNKKFLLTHAAFLGSIVYDAELTHEGLAHHKCVESNPSLGTHPSRGEIYEQNMLVFGAVTGLDWVTAKLRIRYLPYVSPIVGSAVHFTGGSKWLTECW